MEYFKIRPFKIEQDYGIINQWWIDHGSFAPRIEHLSPDGLVIEYDNKPVCAGFLYRTPSKICVFEFVVSDPEADKKIRSQALDLLIKSTIEWANTNEFSLIYTSINIKSYINKLKNNGFIEADTNQTHMFREI